MSFPILTDYHERRDNPHWPVSVPWDLIAPHEKQAFHNHSQSLRRLAERGGLGVMEMYAVLTDRDFREVVHLDPDFMMDWIMHWAGLRKDVPRAETPVQRGTKEGS